MKISVQFLLIFLVLFLIFGGVTIVLIGFEEKNNLEELFIRKGIILAKLSSSVIESSYLKGYWPYKMLDGLTTDRDVLFWWIVDNTGRIRLSSDKRYWGQQIQIITFQEDIYIKEVSFEGHEVKVFISKLQLEGESEPWYLYLGLSTESLREVQKRTTIMLLASFGLFVMLAYALSLILAKRVAAPILDLRDAINKIMEGNFDIKLKEKERKDEIGELAKAIEELAKSLKVMTKY